MQSGHSVEWKVIAGARRALPAFCKPCKNLRKLMQVTVFLLLRPERVMRVVVGTCFILAGLAVGTHGFSRVASSPPDALPEIASERLPTRAVTPSPLPAVSAIVTLPTKAPTSTRPPTPPVPASAKHPADGSGLVRELQHELRRAECYDGAINGTWTAPTREAMRTFVEQVNAKLPIDKPNHILLALLQGNPGQACGSCPAGQEASGDSRCPPNAVVARAALAKGTPLLENASRPFVSDEKPTTTVAERPRKTARSAHRAAPIEGRMSVGAGIIAPAHPAERGVRLAAAAPIPSNPPAAQPQRERRAARHGDGRSATFRSRAYLRPMRPARYAFRPFRRPRGIAALFGFF
jgi:hypothetical protein